MISKAERASFDLYATTGVTLYYNANDPQNAYLVAQIIALSGGGSLDPYAGSSGGVAATPEHSAWLLFGTGVVLTGFLKLRKRKGVADLDLETIPSAGFEKRDSAWGSRFLCIVVRAEEIYGSFDPKGRTLIGTIPEQHFD